MSKKGKCIIVSAPSGAGKTTIVHHLLKQDLGLEFSVSAASRDQRGEEQDKKDYYFLGLEGFKQKIKENAFLEWEEVYPNQYYGTLKTEIQRIWSKGKHVIFDVDVIGGLNLKKKFKDQALSIFIQPPSVNALQNRLESRETETPEKIAIRIGKAKEELECSDQFDKVILNKDLETALHEAEEIVKEFIQ